MAFLTRRLFRLSYPALLAFAWRNRDEVAEWTGFAFRAAQALAPGGTTLDDVKLEARVRLALAKDPRTRRAPGLGVRVREGVVTLRGVVAPDVKDLAVKLVEGVEGVRAVDDQLRETKRRWSRGRDRPALSRAR